MILMVKCKPSYKNVNTVKSFSEQRAATVQVMDRICQNEEYLYQQSEKLRYLTPPATRQRFNPVLVDEEHSYGWMLSDDGFVSFDSSLRKVLPKIDFTDLSLIDQVNSDCLIESGHATISPKTIISTNTSCKNYDPGDGINSFWYCGFDKNKPYQIRPDWIKNPFDSEIPAICRAQTIEIPNSIDGNKMSLLESVTLNIQSQGDNSSDWASPLFVQLWEVESVNVPETVWQNNQNVPTGNSTSVYVPKGNPNAPLASCVTATNETILGNFTFVFDTPVRVRPGEHYAIVVLSPLSHWDHCPRVGGWGRNCNVVKDNGGDAFLSENNGRTWVRYGHNDSNTKLEYKLGKYTPQDFAFQATIRTYEEVYDTDNEYYLYLKPIRSSQIESIYLSAQVHGDANNEDCDVTFQVSTDMQEWFTPESALIPFEADDNGNYPSVVFIRAILSTDTPDDAPIIDFIEIIINKQFPKKMYVRTPFFKPKLSPMLGANVWGRVYAPFDSIPTNAEDVDCKVEIIQETPSKEHFHIITVNELDLYQELEDNNQRIIGEEGLVANPDKRAEYLIDNPSVLNKLKKHHVYIKPYTLEGTEYLLSFETFDDDGNSMYGGLKLDNSPAYPLHECKIQPIGTEKIRTYGEGYDLLMDYETDILTIKRSILDDLPIGSLSITYNKCFIQDLINSEVGDRINEETGLAEEGLILDYFMEEIFIGSMELENRKVQLRVVPLDPVREVKIIQGDEETELYEDKDFTVDCKNKELIFKPGKLQLNDTLKIVYTPHLEDTGIAIGYTVTRKDINHQIRIKPNYIEYK